MCYFKEKFKIPTDSLIVSDEELRFVSGVFLSCVLQEPDYLGKAQKTLRAWFISQPPLQGFFLKMS